MVENGTREIYRGLITSKLLEFHFKNYWKPGRRLKEESDITYNFNI